jgi:hypothetical protein
LFPALLVIYFKIVLFSAFPLKDVHFYLIFPSFEEREAAIDLAGMTADYDQEVIIGILISVKGM